MKGIRIQYNIPNHRSIITEMMTYPEAIMQVQNDFVAGYIVTERMTLPSGASVPKMVVSTAGMSVQFNIVQVG